MELPSSLTSTLFKEKAVFYFISEQVNQEPHNFVVIKNDNNTFLFFSCCTSRHDTVYNHIKRNNYDEATMTSLDYNKHSFLKKPTFINCNTKIEYSYSVFVDLYENGKIKHKGSITDEEYENIVKGILLSEEIEEELKDKFR